MNSINKYIDVFEELINSGVTGMGPPTVYIVESSAKHLCKDGKETSTEELKKEVEKRLRDMLLGYKYDLGWLNKSIEGAKKHLEEVTAVIDCSLENVPLYVNTGYVAIEIAKYRLEKAE